MRATVGAAGVLAIAMLLAPVAHAKTSCAYAGAPTNLLTVTVSGELVIGAIERKGLEITAHENLEAPVPCAGGTPTVLNTDSIVVRVSTDSYFDLRLNGGPLAPGATGEPEGAAEIEIDIAGAGFAEVIGISAGDEFRWGPGGALAGLNLNPRNDGDRDVDVTVSGDDSFLIANGAGGDDTITAQPGASIRDGVYSIGGPGNDVLRAPPGTNSIIEGGSGNDVIIGSRSHDLLDGEGGNDRVSGRAGPDEITGGRGTDRLSGGSGRDDINSRDSKRDSVSCGPGRDRVKADRRDHLRGCETRRIAR